MTNQRVSVPASFLWGAATSAHQTEGNNTSSDLWALENIAGSPMPERSGDACDSYHRWPDDLDIVAELGLNTYRFGIEWSRIEPEPGKVSMAALAHYRRMIEGCADRGLTPMVTLHHFSSPLWFSRAGGWTAPDAIEMFRRYVRSTLAILDGVEWVATINEPNMVALVSAIMAARRAENRDSALTAGAALVVPDQAVADALIAAHHAAQDELDALRGVRSGWTVANQNFQAVTGAEAAAAEWAWSREDQFLVAAKDDAYVGVQAYSRTIVGADGPVELADDARRTLMGWEFYPQAVGDAVRHTADTVSVPIVVTENGVATAGDDERIEYTRGALAELGAAIADGIDVRGYLHWSLLDNYEWGSWAPTFGLVAVDRDTFARTVKPSARWYGVAASDPTFPSRA